MKDAVSMRGVVSIELEPPAESAKARTFKQPSTTSPIMSWFAQRRRSRNRIEATMTTTNLTVARTDVPTGLSYEALVQRFEATLGTWDPATTLKLVERKAPWTEVEAAPAG